MRVFVAGGAGAIGRRLVPQLVARGHQVTATTTSAAKLGLLEQLGADSIVMDGLSAASVGEAVAAARPDAIVHEMTALSVAHNGKPNFRHPERLTATTNRLRTEGTDHLLAAAEATGVMHVVAQSVAALTQIRNGGPVSEEDPLPSQEVGPKMRGAAEALRHVEEVVVRAGGAALRYGGSTGLAPPTIWSSWCESVGSRLSGAAPATSIGCISTTRQAPPCLPWSSRRRACSTSSTTSLHRSGSGCPISPREQGPGGRCGCPSGWRSCSLGKW